VHCPEPPESCCAHPRKLRRNISDFRIHKLLDRLVRTIITISGIACRRNGSIRCGGKVVRDVSHGNVVTSYVRAETTGERRRECLCHVSKWTG
jgi:hypothetical protein